MTGGLTIDLTSVVVAIVGGVFSVITIVAGSIINSHVKDATAREGLRNAVANALGALQQAGQAAILADHPVIVLASRPGVPNGLLPGVQYVLNNAGADAKRLGITPPMIADKISAQIGLAAIKSNIATASSPDPSPMPLAPLDPLAGSPCLTGEKNAAP